MELTKEQIQKVNSYLKDGGIKYWDIRIEMVDHIVSAIENDGESKDFETALIKALKEAKWYNNLYSIHTQSWKNTNKIYRKQYFKNIVNFFYSIKNVCILLVGVLLYYKFIYPINSFKVFNKVNGGLYFLPIIIFIILVIKNEFKYRFKKSVNLQYGIFYFGFTSLMLNSVFIFIDKYTEDIQRILWILVLLLTYVATYSGYQVYIRSVRKTKKLLKGLQLCN